MRPLHIRVGKGGVCPPRLRAGGMWVSLLAAVGLCLTALSTHATDYTWDDENADDNWSSTDNWNPNAGGGEPDSDDTVTFDDTGGAAEGTETSVADGDHTVISLSIKSTSDASAHSLTISGGQALTVTTSLIGDAVNGSHLSLLGTGTLDGDQLIVGRGPTTVGRGTLDLTSFEGTFKSRNIVIGQKTTTGVTEQAGGRGHLLGLGAAAPMTTAATNLFIGWGTLDIGAQGVLVVSNSMMVGRHTYRTSDDDARVTGRLRMREGSTFQLGSTDTRAKLTLGERYGGSGNNPRGVVRSVSGSTNRFYLDDLMVANNTVNNWTSRGTLDLREGNNILNVRQGLLEVGLSVVDLLDERGQLRAYLPGQFLGGLREPAAAGRETLETVQERAHHLHLLQVIQ